MLRSGEPVSQVEIENELLRLLDILEDCTITFRKLATDEAEAEADYKHAWAKEYLSAKGSIKERESWAAYKLESELRQWKIAEALCRSMKEKLTSLRTSIDALRTLNANVRAQV
jgi:hypothetical protein